MAAVLACGVHAAQRDRWRCSAHARRRPAARAATPAHQAGACSKGGGEACTTGVRRSNQAWTHTGHGADHAGVVQQGAGTRQDRTGKGPGTQCEGHRHGRQQTGLSRRQQARGDPGDRLRHGQGLDRPPRRHGEGDGQGQRQGADRAAHADRSAGLSGRAGAPASPARPRAAAPAARHRPARRRRPARTTRRRRCCRRC